MYFGNETVLDNELTYRLNAQDCDDLASACCYASLYLKEHAGDNITGPEFSVRLDMLQALFVTAWYALEKREAKPDEE